MSVHKQACSCELELATAALWVLKQRLPPTPPPEPPPNLTRSHQECLIHHMLHWRQKTVLSVGCPEWAPIRDHLHRCSKKYCPAQTEDQAVIRSPLLSHNPTPVSTSDVDTAHLLTHAQSPVVSSSCGQAGSDGSFSPYSLELTTSL